MPTEDRTNRREGHYPHLEEQEGRGDAQQTGAHEAFEPVDDASEQQDDHDRGGHVQLQIPDMESRPDPGPALLQHHDHLLGADG